MRTVREEIAAQRALDDALAHWSRTADAWEAITWITARDPEIGTSLNESGTMRAYTLEGVGSLGLPTITVLYEVSPDYVTIHAAQFSEALHRDAGRG